MTDLEDVLKSIGDGDAFIVLRLKCVRCKGSGSKEGDTPQGTDVKTGKKEWLCIACEGKGKVPVEISCREFFSHLVAVKRMTNVAYDHTFVAEETPIEWKETAP